MFSISKYLLPIAAGAAALLAVATTVQTYRLDAARTRADVAAAEAGRLRIAAAGSEETIVKLRDSLAALRADAVAQSNAIAAAANALDAYKQVIAAQADRLTELEAKDYDKPDCQALLDADLAAVCPAHADGVRKRAAGGLQGSPARGADPRP